ncbi:MAG: hypothetical protein ACFE8Z_06960, partial [Candidatus Hermodarchaeota archaeon]
MSLTKYQSRIRTLSISLFIMELVLVVSLCGLSFALVDSSTQIASATKVQSQSISTGYWPTSEWSTSTPEDQG